MILNPDSSLVANEATFASAKPASSFLSKYSIAVPDAISSLAYSHRTIPLDPTYQPGCYDVVCGRGKGSYNRPGNKRFRAIVATFASAYQQARTKVDKSAVLSGIVDKVRSYNNPDTGLPTQFVKYTKGTGWVQIGDDLAREKVGHAMREAVTTQAARTATCGSPSTHVTKQIRLAQGETLGAEDESFEDGPDSTFRK
jgi:hypothetical protein